MPWARWPWGIAWMLIGQAAQGSSEATTFTYGWNAIGGLLLVSWGVAEARAERINMGMALVALTVLTFYFSEVMDKMGRSASMIGLGVLFLAGGWGMETMRRRLLDRATQRLGRVRLEVRQGRVVATPARGTATTDPASRVAMIERRRNRTVAALLQPVAFFLPEHGADPSLRPAGEELWAEVTLPPQGPPRPIRLGVSRGDRIEPLNRR